MSLFFPIAYRSKSFVPFIKEERISTELNDSENSCRFSIFEICSKPPKNIMPLTKLMFNILMIIRL